MAVEIERKFLLRDDDWRKSVQRTIHIRQGYLANQKTCSVRVRTSGEHAWLNVKSLTVGAERQEFEYSIPLTDAATMLDTLTTKPLIEKQRHYVMVGGHTWEIDEFEGDNAGLIVAEVELRDVDELFAKPAWVGEEVTHDPRYYNTQLSKHPFKEW
jgi:adenylate cyclase